MLGLVYITLELAAATGWAFAGHRLRVADLRARTRRRLDQAVGGVFLGLAGLLALAEHLGEKLATQDSALARAARRHAAVEVLDLQR